MEMLRTLEAERLEKGSKGAKEELRQSWRGREAEKCKGRVLGDRLIQGFLRGPNEREKGTLVRCP